jgi:hypothetical protein
MPVPNQEGLASMDSLMIAFVEKKRALMEQVMNDIRTKYSIERGRA